MPRALDHLVVPSRDLGALAETFRQLGFQVGARNRHPWGTENHIIQFDGTFIELIGLAEDFRAPAGDDPAAPFAGFVAGFLDRHDDGVGMAVLRSADATGDAVRFAATGIGHGRTLPFSRTSRTPEGEERTVAFTIAFADAPKMPEIGFFVCEQHRPENFWNSAFQRHPGGVTGLAGFVIIAREPADHLPFLTAFADGPEAEPMLGGYAVPLDGGRIEVLTHGGFASAYGGTSTPSTETPRLAAILVRRNDVATRTGPSPSVVQASKGSAILLIEAF